MPTDTALVVNGQIVGVERSFTPAEVGLDAHDVKPASVHDGNVLDLQGFSDFMISVVIAGSGTRTTGLASLRLNLYNEQDVNILTDFDMTTSINTKAANVYTVCFGRTNTTVDSHTSGTPALSADKDIIRMPARMKVSLSVTEVGNGTTQTATVYVRAAR